MDRKELEQTLASLIQQELQAVHQLGEIRGALNMVRSFLSKLETPPPPQEE